MFGIPERLLDWVWHPNLSMCPDELEPDQPATVEAPKFPRLPCDTFGHIDGDVRGVCDYCESAVA